MGKHLLSAIRPVREDEMNFVLSTWSKSFARTVLNHNVPRHTCIAWQRRTIDQILARDPLVLVAADPDFEDTLYGSIVAERIGASVFVHWTYVKYARRRLRVATDLLADALRTLGNGASRLHYTHHTRFDAKAEAMGMTYVPIDDVLRPVRRAS